MDDLYIYGGTHPWDTALWETTDDRVRGGASQSYLYVVNPEHSRFYGHLDISTLGGAGFASQNSVGELSLDLSAYDGILITVIKSDDKKYIISLKDEIPGQREDGRKQSGVSWEADFSVSVKKHERAEVFLPWSEFQATYRGRSKPDAKPLDLSDIKRISLMMRSFFGEQEGDFRLDLHSIAARRKTADMSSGDGQPRVVRGRVSESESEDGEVEFEKPPALDKSPDASRRRSLWTRLLCGLV